MDVRTSKGIKSAFLASILPQVMKEGESKAGSNFFVDGCGCQEVELRTSLTNGSSRI